MYEIYEVTYESEYCGKNSILAVGLNDAKDVAERLKKKEYKNISYKKLTHYDRPKKTNN